MMEHNHELLQKQHSGIWRSLRDGDFEEEEVWDVVNEREKPQYNNKKTKQSLSSSSSSSVPLSVPRPLPSASRMIPRTNSSNNIHTSTFNSAIIEGKVLQQSAPVNIPDWSKIYNINNKIKKKQQSKGVSSSGFLQDYDFAEDDEEGDKNEQVFIKYDDEEDDEEQEDDEFDVKLPPHEFIAKRLAKTQISSFSVFEGVGRTLKGRDLSKVRNAVLIKTGFLESL
ncbi:hypothetical protein QN277_018533 [Acacia crassicarpa]|uniref:Senescence regulator n=2 Tax=Acacia crassicarpa TaxID=499986 RepID=A0AAE1MUN9_9FABA|nr:hypothetical protein QN277_018533 [Acacia crassicarpa]